MMALQRWFTLLMSQWLMLLPCLLLGALCSTVLMMFTPRDWWERFLPKNTWLQLLYGLGLGLILPVGQYGALPVTRRLLWQSGSSSLAIAFWLSAASIHPLILWQIWQHLPENHGVVLSYGGLSLLVVLLISSIFISQRQQITREGVDGEVFQYPAIARPSSYRLTPNSPEQNPALGKLNILPTARKFRLAMGWHNLVKEWLEWSLWLLLACMITATVQLLVSGQQWLTGDVWGVFGWGIFGSIDSFQNVVLVEQILGDRTVGMGLSLLLVGAFFNLPSLILMGNVFRVKAFAYLSVLLFLVTLLLNFWLNFYIF